MCAGFAGSARAQCLDLRPGFGLPGPADTVWCTATLDTGSGDVLYVGGAFTDVDGLAASHIARWDGTAWSALGDGVDGDVHALAVFDDGSGPAVYAGGMLTGGIARWNGSAWSAVGTGTDGAVLALTVFDDGSGPALYAAGDFATAGGVSASHVAKWSGSTWSALGSGTDGTVDALAVFDDGSGSALAAAGSFGSAGSAPASNVAKWDGAAWSALGSGIASPVAALTVFAGSAGSTLCAGGSDVSSWDGSAWSPLGIGGPACVLALAPFDDGSGPALYAAGFQGCGSSIAKWDGLGWSQQNLNWYPFAVHSMSVFDGGTGASLFAGAEVLFTPYALPLYMARLSGTQWVPVGNADGADGGVLCLIPFDDGSGPSLFAAGTFDAAGSTGADRIARFDGTTWSPVGLGIGDGTPGGASVVALAAFDDGSGSALYAGGSFASAGGAPAQDVARWDGSQWTALGSGLAGGPAPSVRAMAVFDDGGGPALFVGGDFTSAGGSPVDRIARWDGHQWSALAGGGVSGGFYPSVYAMHVFDDGTGPALYVAGMFTMAGNAPAANVARWNGSTWTSLGSGISPAAESLAVFDDGSGLALYAGNSGGVNGRVYRWDGSTWNPVGSGDLGSCGVASMTVFDDGSGPSLFACTLQCAKGPPDLYRWDGFRWSYLASPPTFGAVGSMVALDGIAGPSAGLYLACEAPEVLPGQPFSGIARFVGCSEPGVPFCAGDGLSGTCPCGNTGSFGHGCENSAGTGGALLAGSGDAALSDDTFRMTASSERASALTVFWESESFQTPRSFGDGLGCIAGSPKRLYVHNAVAGVAIAPQGADASVSQVSANRGVPIVPGTARTYQAYYRDPNPNFCPPPAGSTFNTTNALRTYWRP